jgi:type I restriction enzyme S subunit
VNPGVQFLPLLQAAKPTRPRVKPSDHPDLPFIGMEHVEAHTMKLLGTVPAGTMKSSAVHFKPGDVLYGRLRPYLNKVYRPTFEGLCSAEFIVLPENDRVDGGYLQYYLNSAAFVRYASHLNTGDRPRVDFDQLAPYEIPLPPIDEQRRIVAEIEKQFSRLDEGVANLKRAKANLKRYKAAVLKAAVEGRLVPTEAELARREGRSYETGAQLLQRILEARRRNWRGRGKYKEPDAVAAADLPVLPLAWAWASTKQLSSGEPYSLAIGPFGSSLKVSDYTESGVPLVFVRNIRSRVFDDENGVFVSAEKAEELQAHLVEAGDLLVTKMGDPPGDVCVYPDNRPPAIVTADCIKLRPSPVLLERKFIEYAIAAETVKRQILGVTKGVAQLKVSLGRFSTVGIPVPPLAEQQRIVAEVDRRFSLVREVEAEVDANLKRSQAVRQALLSGAFNSRCLSR